MTIKTPLICTACLLLAGAVAAPLVSCSDEKDKAMDDSNTDIDTNTDTDTETDEITSEELKPQFPGITVEGDLIETDSGLKYYDIVVGDGAQPAGPTSRVKVHYTGYLVDGTKFDSSVDRGQPSTFRLSGVIRGWTEGVGSMRVGGKRKLIIPYALGYGVNGGRGIPPKAMLIFDIELLEIVGE